MSMLARYKKAGGLMELVKLIEESGEPKKSQLMGMVLAEDPDFAAQVQAKVYSYEKIRALPEGIIAEVIGSTPPKIVALAVQGETEDFIKLVERCLGKNFAEYKAEKEILVEKPAAPPQIESARRKLLTEARKLEKDGRIKLPDMGASDSSGLGGTGSDSSSTGPAAASASGVPVEQPGENTNTAIIIGPDGTKAPIIKSFGIDPAPPGLSGERLETFFKNSLGK